MVKISKKTQDFLISIGEETTVTLKKMPSGGRSTVIPGRILIFRYFVSATQKRPGTRGQRVILVVRTKSGDGLYVSPRGNLLVSCFRLEGKSDVIVSTIVENLYKKRRRSSYYGKIKESLKSLLGVDSFRTYKLSQMKDVYSLALGFELAR